MKKRRKKITIIGAAAALFVASLFVLDSAIFPLPLDKLNKPPSRFVYARDGRLLRCFISVDDYWRKPVALEDISPLLIKSVLAREDRWFYYHPGVNVFSLFEALIDNIKAGEIVRGGSTITMQIARMIEPKPRTVKSKLIEILRAMQLELHYSKSELLELYFNIAPYGGNIEGIGAASYFYFDKSPIELTAGQAALLTSIPNSPTYLRPDLNVDNCYDARARVLAYMLDGKIIDSLQYQAALLEKINPEKTSPPFKAPHLCRDLALEYPGQGEITTTIDSKIQQTCEAIVKHYQYALQTRAINNAAVIVIDNRSSEVLALIGSPDFFDNKHQGQINGATALRSPGSALKPFAYALALDEGIISPAIYLEDLPVYYSGYSPENYDDSYRGVVSAADALRMSLNVPAVNLCAQTGLDKFFKVLKSGGLSTLNGKYYDYGLPLVLGSCEVKLLELTNLYSALGRGGIWRPYRLIKDDSRMAGDTLFSPEASYIIAEILSDVTRPDFPSSWEFSANLPKIAWKTGTSYGRRDAWSIGFNPHYTVGVWVGNFTGEPSPNLVGAESAAPILFDIFTTISSKTEDGWFTRPENVGIRDVCALTGLIPGPFCKSTKEELYIHGVSPSRRCDVHQVLTLDSHTGCKLCPYCSEGKNTIDSVFQIWPAKISTWLKKSGSLTQTVPIHNPDCRGTYYGDRPEITSPKPDVNYIIRDYLPASQQGILLDASAASGTKDLYWFIDGVLYGKIRPGERLFYIPQAGKHNIICSDDQGRSSSLELKISN